jgi:hypothetical protein
MGLFPAGSILAEIRSMFRWSLLLLLMSATLWAQSPSRVELHLRLPEKGGPIGYTYRLYDLPEGDHLLLHSGSVRRTKLRIYQKNILKESSLEKEEHSTLLRVRSPAQDRQIVFQQGSTAPDQGWTIGTDMPWPFVAPASWNCPLLLSIEGKLDQWDILWPAEAQLIVEDGSQKSVFFGPTQAAPLHSQLLQIFPKAQVIALAQREKPILNAIDIESPEGRVPSSDIQPICGLPSVPIPEEERIEPAFVQSIGKRFCIQWETDSLLLLGKKRDERLRQIQESFGTSGQSVAEFEAALAQWRFQGYGEWGIAALQEREQEQERELQFLFNKRSYYADLSGNYDPLADTSSLGIRAKRWYLSTLDEDTQKEICCQLFDPTSSKEPHPSGLWNDLIQKGIRPMIRLNYRLIAAQKTLQIRMEQLQEQTVDVPVDLRISGSQMDTVVGLRIRGRSDTIEVPFHGSVHYLKIDPDNRQPVFWLEEKNDLQFLMELRDRPTKGRRLELMEALFDAQNSNLLRTAVGIGLYDDWKEIRILTLLYLNGKDPDFVALFESEIDQLARTDADQEVRSYAQDVQMNQP